MIVALVLATKSATRLEEDSITYDDLSEQARILMYRLQHVVKAGRIPIMLYFIINAIASI